MAIGSLALNTTVTTNGAPAWDVKPGSTIRPRVMELGLNLGAATASTYGIGRSANTPVQTSPVSLQAEDAGDGAFVTGCAVAWGTAPTIPTQFLRRVSLPATIGAGIIFTWPRGLVLSTAGASLVLWNLAANAASLNVHVVADE